MRGLLIALALLVGCSEWPPMPAPKYTSDGREIQYRRSYLRGADGVAIPSEPAILLDVGWEGLPEAVRLLVLWHEWCHLEGADTEIGADCCALAIMDLVGYSDHSTAPTLALWYMDTQAARAVWILECGT